MPLKGLETMSVLITLYYRGSADPTEGVRTWVPCDEDRACQGQFTGSEDSGTCGWRSIQGHHHQQSKSG